MIVRVIMLVTLVPVVALAQAPSCVPADSKNNRLVLNIENTSTRTDVESLRVFILRHGPGITFRSAAVLPGRLVHGRSADVELVFDVDRTAPLDRPDTVVVGFEGKGRTLGEHSMVWVFSGPARFTLDQNFPNPFNPSTTVHFALPEQAQVVISVFDLLGRHVRTLIDGPLEKGYRSGSWDGTTASGQAAGSGVYFLRMTARPARGGQEFLQTRKVLLLR